MNTNNDKIVERSSTKLSEAVALFHGGANSHHKEMLTKCFFLMKHEARGRSSYSGSGQRNEFMFQNRSVS